MKHQMLQKILLGLLGAALGLAFCFDIAFANAEDAGPSPAQETQDTDEADDKDPVFMALEEIRNGRVNQGIQKLVDYGQKGNAEAYFHLGQIYALGAGRKKDTQIAGGYFRSAARLGHQRAELSLANLLYFDGQPGENYEEAYRIYKNYALAGEPEAQYVLGMIYWNGDVSEDQDPIRGYALIWLASENGFEAALDAELQMHSQLNFEARREARRYALSLQDEGFSRTPLKLELLEEKKQPDVPTLTKNKLKNASDWKSVWHVEVGNTTSQQTAERLVRVIGQTMATEITGLSSLVVENPNLPGRYKVLYGPFASFQDAVFQCVKFKARGHDCFSRAPL